MTNPERTATITILFLGMASLILTSVGALAQGTTAFTYQGQLTDSGKYANGTYTMIFALYDSAAGGDQIGPIITNNTTLANGLFTVNLDFGPSAFNGNPRWLDITVTNGPDTQELSPRVQVLPAPYAQFAAAAATVTNAAALPATPAETNLLIIRGTIDSSGDIAAGEGFSVQVTTATNRTINFTTPFSGIPTIALGQHGSSGGSIVDLVSSSTSSFSTVANGSAGFEFIAIGPK
ncbi:MAG TPA: hypothetical protein VMF08_22335 [Candidatus Sulfotelmatobacter sp.]|nr:hypothetical protein [Candidatus Sulfotelmatobacter sp.]